MYTHCWKLDYARHVTKVVNSGLLWYKCARNRNTKVITSVYNRYKLPVMRDGISKSEDSLVHKLWGPIEFTSKRGCSFNYVLMEDGRVVSAGWGTTSVCMLSTCPCSIPALAAGAWNGAGTD